MCCASWGRKELDTTERLNWNWMGKIGRQEEKGKTEEEMVGWHHRLDGHESEQTRGVGDGQGGLACCSPWDYPGKNTEVGCYFLLQVLFMNQ